MLADSKSESIQIDSYGSVFKTCILSNDIFLYLVKCTRICLFEITFLNPLTYVSSYKCIGSRIISVIALSCIRPIEMKNPCFLDGDSIFLDELVVPSCDMKHFLYEIVKSPAYSVLTYFECTKQQVSTNVGTYCVKSECLFHLSSCIYASTTLGSFVLCLLAFLGRDCTSLVVEALSPLKRRCSS